MTDFRAFIKVEMDFMDITKKTELNINYHDNGDGIDQRIVDFFSDAYDEGMLKYYAEIERDSQIENQKKIESEERIELKNNGWTCWGKDGKDWYFSKPKLD